MAEGSIKKSTVIVFLFTGISSILGFARESYIAYMYGATGLTDAFYIAAIVPETVAGLFQIALTNSLIPVLKEEKNTNENSARLLVNSIFRLALVVLLVLTVGVVFFGRDLIGVLAPGFLPNEANAGIHLLSIMVISVVFTGLSGVLWGVNNAYESYAFPALVGVAYNTMLLLFALLLAPFIGIYSLGAGVAAGALGRFFVQFIPLRRMGVIKITTRLWHKRVPDVLALMPPVMLGSGLSAVNLIVDRILASGLPYGDITVLNFMTKLGTMGSMVIGGSLATTLYTRFVSSILSDDNDRVRELLIKGVSWALFLGLVVGGAFVFYSYDIVTVLFKHGAFGLADVERSVHPLQLYGVFQPFYIAQPMAIRLLYARRENKFATVSYLICELVNISCSLLTVRSLGILGLVLGNGLSQLTCVFVAMYIIFTREQWPLLLMIKTVIVEGALPGLVFLVGLFLADLSVKLMPQQTTLDSVIHCVFALVIGACFTTIFSLIYRNNSISKFILRSLKVSVK